MLAAWKRIRQTYVRPYLPLRGMESERKFCLLDSMGGHQLHSRHLPAIHLSATESHGDGTRLCLSGALAICCVISVRSVAKLTVPESRAGHGGVKDMRRDASGTVSFSISDPTP